MTGGGLTVSNSAFVGYSGTGYFSQSGGTNTATNNLYLGYNSGDSGVYNLSGAGQIAFSYGSTQFVGYSGTGTFTQSGGTNTTFFLDLAYEPGSSGTYNLQSGLLVSQAAQAYVGWGGTGTFNQSGGTYNAWFLQIGYMGTGTYSLSGTGLFDIFRR